MDRRNRRKREPVLPRHLAPVTGYRERQYQRSAVKRLTPLAWFLVGLAVLAIAGLVIVVVSKIGQGSGSTLLLSDLLATATVQQVNPAQTAQAERVAANATGTATARKAAAANATQTPVARGKATAQPQATSLPQATSEPTARPLPSPTFDVNGAAWQGQLVLQPDGTLQAPDDVLQRARNELTEYYTLLRDLPLDDYLSKRDEILNKYFTGAALEGLQKSVINRTQYLMNRAGDISIEVRDFSSNGLAATAGIRAHGWVNDVYDIASKQLVTEGRLETDTFSVVRIVFDRASERWKFAIVKQVTEVTRP